MKNFRLVALLILPLLFGCYPKKPEIPMVEVPAGPLVQALEQRSGMFSNLKALASVEFRRKSRRQSFESVAVLVDRRDRFRIEAYGPLGEVLLTAVWNGNRIAVRPENLPLDRILGKGITPADLCAVLAGNVPGSISGSQPRLLCADSGLCVLELRHGDMVIKVFPDAESESQGTVSRLEAYRDDTLQYRVMFSSFEPISGYPLPRKIVLENPGEKITLTVEYIDTDVNVQLAPSLFETGSRGGQP